MNVAQLREYLATLDGEMLVVVEGRDHSYSKALPFTMKADKMVDDRGRTHYVEYFENEYVPDTCEIVKCLLFSAR